jgi:hypothetical protein
MLGQRPSKAIGIAAALGAAFALTTAAPAAAETAPPCEVMLPPDVCEQFFYGPLSTVSSTTYWLTRTAEDTVWDVAMFADDTLKCVGWEDCD